MSADITMPQLSDTMTEGTLVKWLKKEGDKVNSGETIAEIETDKAVMEMEVFDAGVVAALVIAEGQKAAVGSLLAVIATGSENPAEVKKKVASRSQPAAAAAPAPPVSRQEVAASRKPVMAVAASAPSFAQTSGREIREPDHVGHGATRETAVAVPPLPHGENGGRFRASPLARRIARMRNIDLRSLDRLRPRRQNRPAGCAYRPTRRRDGPRPRRRPHPR